MFPAKGVAEKFMKIIDEQRKLSGDPHFKTGACLVSANNEVIGKGFNCMPNNQNNDFPWDKSKENKRTLEYKHLYVCHGELNAIVDAVKARKLLQDSTMYTYLFPCNECAKVIVQFGIKKVVYDSDEKWEKVKYQASKRTFDKTGVQYRAYSALE